MEQDGEGAVLRPGRGNVQANAIRFDKVVGLRHVQDPSRNSVEESFRLDS